MNCSCAQVPEPNKTTDATKTSPAFDENHPLQMRPKSKLTEFQLSFVVDLVSPELSSHNKTNESYVLYNTISYSHIDRKRAEIDGKPRP